MVSSRTLVFGFVMLGLMVAAQAHSLGTRSAEKAEVHDQELQRMKRGDDIAELSRVKRGDKSESLQRVKRVEDAELSRVKRGENQAQDLQRVKRVEENAELLRVKRRGNFDNDRVKRVEENAPFLRSIREKRALHNTELQRVKRLDESEQLSRVKRGDNSGLSRQKRVPLEDDGKEKRVTKQTVKSIKSDEDHVINQVKRKHNNTRLAESRETKQKDVTSAHKRAGHTPRKMGWWEKRARRVYRNKDTKHKRFQRKRGLGLKKKKKSAVSS